MECFQLMIVVAIIGILAAFAIPAYQDYIARTQASEAVSLMNGLKTDSTDNLQNGECGTRQTDGSFTPLSATGKYVVVTGSTGAPDATNGCVFNAQYTTTNISDKIQGKKLQAGMGQTGSLKVIAGAGTDIDTKYIPKAIL